jgi:hypothetical protein
MDPQFAIALSTVALSAIWLVWRAVRFFRGRESGCSSCPQNSRSESNSTRVLPLAQIQVKPREK